MKIFDEDTGIIWNEEDITDGFMNPMSWLIAILFIIISISVIS